MDKEFRCIRCGKKVREIEVEKTNYPYCDDCREWFNKFVVKK